MFKYKLSNLSTILIALNIFWGSFGLYAQVTIKYPYERTVFQRKNDNTGKIHLSGNLDSFADRVEAGLVPRAAGQGVGTEWTIIDNNIEGQSFTGSIDGTGGWYRLEVRAVKDNQATFTNAVERVGIGEVFVVAGQSNAQGDGNNPNSKGAIDDRVVAYNKDYFNHLTFNVDPLPDFFEYEPFVQLSQSTSPGPTGYTPWAYGELGDYLARKLNVPILFFNASASGTSSENWVKSINGQDTYHVFVGYKFDRYFPYNALKKTLQSYIGILGLRAILWHQGEFDLFNSEQGYFDNVRNIIQETRNNTGENIPWVISRTSRLGSNTYAQVISGQNRVISNVPNTWPGPATDDIQPIRPDGAHFQNTPSEAGISQLASAWNNALTSSFFQNITPISPKGIVEVKHECIDQKSVRIKFDKSYTDYVWSNGVKSSEQTLTSGEQNAYVKDGFGNTLLTSKIIIPNVYPKIAPVVTTSPSIRLCEGNPITFEAQSPKFSVLWSVGYIGSKFAINLPGNYSARYKTPQGCLSASSDVFSPIFVKPPSKPVIFATDNKYYACEGNTLEFYIENPQNYQIEWSTGASTIGVKTNQNLPKPITVKTYSNFDCPSPVSDSVVYKIVKNPKNPTIEKYGPYGLKVSTLDAVSRYDWYLDNKLLSSQISPQIITEKDGIYSVKSIINFNKPTGGFLECISGQSTQLAIDINEKLYGIQIYPNPSFDSKVYISSVKAITKAEVLVYNSAGQKVYNFELPSVQYPLELDLSPIQPSGKYFVEIKYNGLSRTFPVIFK